ncbi:MAG: GTP-binding protein [Chloroflexi bacterium]|nr:MAG: GTP-binding protein [Chloroflexota bacterium]
MRTVSKKVCLLGDFAVGKTSLARRFVYDLFDDKYISTIGVKVSRKTVAVPMQDGAVVELTMMLWDLAGSEDFSQMRGSYMRGSAGAILVCDLTRPESLLSLEGYLADLRQVTPEATIILVANKSDSPEQRLLLTRVEEAAAALGATCFVTSARTGQNVEEMFRHLGRVLVESA